MEGSLKKGLDILSRVQRAVDDNNETSEYEDIEDLEDTERLVQKLKRSNSASYLLGLSVLLDAKSENYFVAPENYVGFKVLKSHKIS